MSLVATALAAGVEPGTDALRLRGVGDKADLDRIVNVVATPGGKEGERGQARFN